MKNFVRVLSAVTFCVLLSVSAVAQQSVPPPPQPAADSQANSVVLKLLRQGVSERVVLHVIAATPGKFDTSAAALAALKQAGADEAELSAILAKGAPSAEQPPAAVVPAAPVAAPAASGPTLADTMKFIQEKLKEQGLVEFVETVGIQNHPEVTIRISARSKDDEVVADPAACTLYAAGTYDSNTVASAGGKTISTDDQHSYLSGTLAFKDVEKITVEPVLDFFNRHTAESGHPEFTATAGTPVFFVELSASKTLFTRHETNTTGNKAPVVTDEPLKEAGLVFRDEETANRVAKAILHAVELCGGGQKISEPF
jgi:hypothetical protein